MNIGGISVALFAAFVALGCRLFRFSDFRGCVGKPSNIYAAWPRSVAQPGSAPDLGTVVPAEFSPNFTIAYPNKGDVPW